MEEKKGLLLVEPDFPFPNKSKHKANQVHKNFVPIGLLKLGAFHRDRGDHVKLVRGNTDKKEIGFIPDEILVTSLFTYWSDYVWNSISYYSSLFPKARIKLGGIYATLHKDTEEFIEKKNRFGVEVFSGVIPEVEDHYPDYSLIPEIDYHATHMMRGCIRRCSFCGTWKLEPKIMYKTKDQVVKELTDIGKNKVIFYDNNLLANPNISEILDAIKDLKINGRTVVCESQSGFDGRILEKKPYLARKLKNARFENIRIAWDNGLEDKASIKKQIDILSKVGYNPNDISVFMIYNYEMPIKDMIQKIKYCFKWGVQITDCRNRPLHITSDGYNPQKWRTGQTSDEYFIHEKWTDSDIRKFRKIVRIHNIVMRYVYSKINSKKVWDIIKDVDDADELCTHYKKTVGYRKSMERWSSIHTLFKRFKLGRPPKLEIIKVSREVQRTIYMLKRLDSYHNNTRTPHPDLSKYNSIRKLNIFLKRYVRQNKIEIDEKEVASLGMRLAGLNSTIEFI